MSTVEASNGQKAALLATAADDGSIADSRHWRPSVGVLVARARPISMCVMAGALMLAGCGHSTSTPSSRHSPRSAQITRLGYRRSDREHRGQQRHRGGLRARSQHRRHHGFAAPCGRSALPHRQRDQSLHGDAHPAACRRAKTCPQRHGRALPAGHRASGKTDHDPRPPQSPLRFGELHRRPNLASPRTTADAAYPIAAFRGLTAPGVQAGPRVELLQHQLHRARPDHRKCHRSRLRPRTRASLWLQPHPTAAASPSFRHDPG